MVGPVAKLLSSQLCPVPSSVFTRARQADFFSRRVDSRLQQSVGFPRVNRAVMEFGQRVLGETDVRDRAVLEVGARDVNGSLRPWIESLQPASYFGVDIVPGTGVD